MMCFLFCFYSVFLFVLFCLYFIFLVYFFFLGDGGDSIVNRGAMGRCAPETLLCGCTFGPAV
jgi:hypothetical protein